VACEVSIVIPSRNEWQNLIWTVQGLQLEFDQDYEIVAVLNQCEPEEAEKLKRFWPAQTGRLKVIQYDERPSCWQARNEGAKEAIGDYILFLDSHVIAKHGHFRRGVEYHRGWRGILHFGVNYWLDHPNRTLYQYTWQPWKFWGSYSRRLPEPPDYRILMSGSAAVLIDRDVFWELGGFHPALGIYGGGEPYLDLKTWMWGYEVRCNPAFQFYHLAERRGYSWNNDDLWQNFMVAAYALGGEQALEPLYQHYIKRCKGVERYLERLEELKAESIYLAEDDWRCTQAKAKRSLDEVICELGG
jgi:glycosyltransferase involved in cell wall biosynthesis